jgi:hypothetical protein
MMDIIFRMQCDVNGKSFEMNGTGKGSFEKGTCDLDLTASPSYPDGFDPVSCPLICSHPTSVFFARAGMAGVDWKSLVGEEYRVAPARVGMIYDAQGQELLNLRISSHVRVERGVLVSEHKMKGTSNLPRLVRNITPVEDYVVAGGPGEANATIRFKLLTASGEILDGMTLSPYVWKGAALPFSLVRTVEDIRVDWDGGARAHAHYRTVLRPMISTIASVAKDASLRAMA